VKKLTRRWPLGRMKKLTRRWPLGRGVPTLSNKTFHFPVYYTFSLSEYSPYPKMSVAASDRVNEFHFKKHINKKWQKAHDHYFTIKEVRSLRSKKYLQTSTFFYRMRDDGDIDAVNLPEVLRWRFPHTFFADDMMCQMYDGGVMPESGILGDKNCDQIVYDRVTGQSEFVPCHITSLADWRARSSESYRQQVITASLAWD
jgi:hypothetical protein